jgi:hypothetical protein
VKHVYRIILAATTAFLATLPLPASASPGSAIILSDDLLGANERSFFVLRTTLLNPPTYYSRTVRHELVEISLWDGSIRSRCLLRQTTSTVDPNTGLPVPGMSEEASPACNPFVVLAEQAAVAVVPLSKEPPAQPVKLAAGTVHINRNGDDNWARLLDAPYVETRARALTRFDPASAPFDVGANDAETFNLYDPWGDQQPLSEACTLRPEVRTLTQAGWVFLHFLCWTGDGDVDGAGFYIPVSAKTFAGE